MLAVIAVRVSRLRRPSQAETPWTGKRPSGATLPPGYASALREVEKRHYGKYIMAILARKQPGEWISGTEVATRFNHLCRSHRIVDTRGAWCRAFRPDYLWTEVAGLRKGVLVECFRSLEVAIPAGKEQLAQLLFRIREEFYEPVAAYCLATGMYLLANDVESAASGSETDTAQAQSTPARLITGAPVAPRVPPAAESADDAEAVRVFYRQLLYREASPEEVLSQLAHNPQHFSREAMLRIIMRSWEYAHVVAPLREIVREVYHSVMLREPLEEEMRSHVNSARERCGSNAATVRAIRSGTVWNLVDIRPPEADVQLDLGSADDVEAVRMLYRSLLYREPTSDELSTHLDRDAESLDRSALRGGILGSWEREQLVVPLRQIVGEAYESFLLREPGEQEIQRHLNTARQRCGSDAATLRSIRSGRIRQFLDIRPINVELDITNRCNLRCVMCLHSHPSYYRRARQDLPLEVFREIAESVFHATRGLSLSYGAESLLHPEFERFLRISTGYGIPKVYLNTNGLLLTESLVEAMVDAGLHQLAVSVDAATPETYARIRVGGDFATLLNNVGMIRCVRERMGSSTPRLSLLFVLMRSNVHELPAFVDLAHAVGATSIVAIHMSPYELLDDVDQSAAFDKSLCNRMMHQANDRAKHYGITLVTPSDFALSGDTSAPDGGATAERFDLATSRSCEGEAVCPFPWHFMAIDMQGDVVPCGWWYGEEPMGNVYNDDAAAVWRNERYQMLRDETASGHLRDVCRTCPAAGMGDPNNPFAFLSR